MRWLFVALGVALFVAATTPVRASDLDPVRGQSIERSYVLSFNRWGELQTPIERDQIIEDLRTDPGIRRILIVSYGWSNDGETSYETYRDLLRDLEENMPAGAQPGRTVVIAVGWDSSQTGFRKLFGDLIPFPVLASTLAFLPDSALFPISFWSKAAMADRIGFGGLRTALNDIFGAAYGGEDDADHPDLYLLGHSFGTRILSGLMQDRLALLPVKGEGFESAGYVRGAAMIQPALALPNLHRTSDYPILVTQSRHDHANGALFPVANLLVNTYSFTSFEGIFRHRIMPVLALPVEFTAGIARIPLPERRVDEDGVPFDPFGLDALRRPYDHAIFLLQRGLAEAVSVPFALLYSAIATPVNYVHAQVWGLASNPVDHVMDTLAQLPVVEILVDGLGAALDRDVAWGARGKGFFDLGLITESSGRIFVQPWTRPRDLPTYSLEELENAPEGDGCNLPVCKGVLFVDASSIVKEGIFGLSLESKPVDYTLGWLDPIGAHADYRNPAVVSLMGRVVLSARSESKSTLQVPDHAPPAATPSPPGSATETKVLVSDPVAR